MRKLFLLLFVCFSAELKAQDTVNYKGIRFDENSSWEEIINKARAEKKYIFVDVFATWCVPCKQMDKMVYTSEKVAEYANKHFVSVKVQIDTTEKDRESIKNRYSVAHDFRSKYSINEFPSFLFFTPSGNIVDRASGFHTPDEFLEVITDATNPKKQLYTLLDNYNRGEKDYTSMPYLARKVTSLLKDNKTASKIAEDYNRNYFNKLKDDQLLSEENILFIAWRPNVLTSKDKYFKLFKEHSEEIDKIIGQHGFSEKILSTVITHEEIWSKIAPDGKPLDIAPNWKHLASLIHKKYGKYYSDRIILNSQITWYSVKKDYEKTIRYNVEKLDKYGLDTTVWGRFSTNNMIYSLIFFHCSDSTILYKASKWMEAILEIEQYKDEESIDTYANLLYKIGKKQEAIKWQERAATLSPDNGEIKLHLAQMKNNQSTWISPK